MSQTSNSNLRKFTLVEMLAVVVILAVLAAMLMPGLQRARERARVVACANNLRQHGIVAFNFAVNNDRKYPEIMNRYGTPYPWHFRNTTSYYGGAPWPVLRDDYGLVGEILNCPDRDLKSENWAWAGYSWSEKWQVQYKATAILPAYFYVAGARRYKNYTAISTHAAKVRISANDAPAELLLASDAVKLVGATYISNHGSKRALHNTGQVRWQNLSFADGHTVSMDQGYYRGGVNRSVASVSVAVWEGSPR